VAPAFAGSLFCAGVIVGWLLGFGSAGTENTAQCQSRTAQLSAANARLADEPQQSQWLTPLPLTAAVG